MKSKLIMIALAALTTGCVTTPSTLPDNEEVLEAHLQSRIMMLQVMDDAFYRLGREYFTLQTSYKDIGNDEMADLVGRQAQQFHKAHTLIQSKLVEAREERLVMDREGDVRLPDDSDLKLEDVRIQDEKPAPPPATPAPSTIE